MLCLGVPYFFKDNNLGKWTYNEVVQIWSYLNWLIPKVNQQLSKVLTLRKVGPSLYQMLGNDMSVDILKESVVSKVIHKEPWNI